MAHGGDDGYGSVNPSGALDVVDQLAQVPFHRLGEAIVDALETSLAVADKAGLVLVGKNVSAPIAAGEARRNRGEGQTAPGLMDRRRLRPPTMVVVEVYGLIT